MATTEEKHLLNGSEHIVQYAANLSTNTVKWAEHLIQAVKEGDADQVIEASELIIANVTELDKHHGLTISLVASLQAMLITAMSQRDQVSQNLQVFLDTFQQQVKLIITQQVNHVFDCDACYHDAKVEHLANLMVEKGVEAAADGAREALDEEIALAYQLVQHWQSEGITEPPGIMSGKTFMPDPEFQAQNEEDPDDEPDDDSDPVEGED